MARVAAAPPRLALLLALALPGSRADGAIVQVSFGELHGRRLTAVDEFLGVPFAEPPLKERRLAPPLDWSKPFGADGYNATQFGARCPQTSWGPSDVPQDESCLYLNVWAPRREQGRHSLLPVLVWIYGGNFVGGAGDMYNGTLFAEHVGAIVVNFNYRVGALGFALIGGGGSNFGLLDQQSALRWLQRELPAFGGDPARLLLFGESAGSISAAAHLLLPGSRGLFSAALMESGVATTVPAAFAHLTSEALLAQLSCSSGTEALACFRSKSWQDIVAAQSNITDPLPNQTMWDVKPAFWIVEDGVTFPESADDLMRRGAFHPVPILVGINHDEGTVFAYEDGDQPMDLPDFSEKLRKLLSARGFHENPGDFETLMAVYSPEASDVDMRPVWGQAIGEYLFVCRSRRFLRWHQGRAGASKAFKYVFEQRAAGDPSPTSWGVYHSSELPFVWGADETGSVMQIPSLTPAEGVLRDSLQSSWISFLANGRPDGVGGVAPWPAYDVKSDSYLEIKEQSFVNKANFRQGPCDAWDKVWDAPQRSSESFVV